MLPGLFSFASIWASPSSLMVREAPGLVRRTRSEGDDAHDAIVSRTSSSAGPPGHGAEFFY
jgi:hypothetical protein